MYAALCYKKVCVTTTKLALCHQVFVEKAKGEILGVVIVESGWGSILPTVIIANMMHAGPAERSGRLNIGDQIMSINGTSLVGLPLSTCQSIIKVKRCTRSASRSGMTVLVGHCDPVPSVVWLPPTAHRLVR